MVRRVRRLASSPPAPPRRAPLAFVALIVVGAVLLAHPRPVEDPRPPPVEPSALPVAPPAVKESAAAAAPADDVAPPELASLAEPPLPRQKPRIAAPPTTLVAKARSGDAAAQIELSAAWARLGDETRAAEWLREAAIAGIPEARFRLAARYREGRGVAADAIEAFIWNRTAAEQGYAPAQLAVGESYERGLGVPASAVEAFAWYTLAAESGDEQGAIRRERLERRLLPAERPLAEARSQSLAAAIAAAGAPNRHLVAEIQRLLHGRGLDPGLDDGFFGERTAEAIRRFQQEDGLSIDGRPSEALLVRLRAGIKPPPPAAE